MQIGMISTLWGGIGRITHHLVQGFSKKHDVNIGLFLIDKRLDYKIDQNTNVIHQYSPKMESPKLSKMKALCDLSLKTLHYDVVHCHYASNAASLKRYRGNLILTMHSIPRPELETGLPDKIAYMFEQSCLHFLPERTKIVTISQYCRDVIKERYNLETQVIYNGIDCNFFTQISNRDVLKIRLGFHNKKVILFVGRLHLVKDPTTLLEAYREVANKISNTLLVIVGQGSLKEKILRLSTKYGLSIMIIDKASDPRLLTLYQCADLFVLPSLGDACPLALIEAMACGIPCLSNTSGAASEILGMKDLLVEPANWKTLAEKMIYLLENPNESQKVSEYLLTRAKGQFSVEEMIRRYYELYRLTINK